MHLTGIFIPPAIAADFPSFDQALMRCEECGHGQLRDTLDPVFLYQDTYTHRSSLSPISTRGNDFFFEFLNDVTTGRRFECVVEVGCNDLYLLRKLDARAKSFYGFDPIWRERDHTEAGRITVSGKYIEEIQPSSDVPEKPDLFISVHTLEHVNDPLASLRPFFDHAREGAMFLLEIPSLDTLIRTARFDQIFHQHLNYFSVGSLQRMVRELGGEYIDHRFNYGYWLGTLMIAFRKPVKGRKPPPPPAPATAPTRALFESQLRLFRGQMVNLRGTLESLSATGTQLFGYGAAQMVPSFAYHLESDLGILECIFDDNTAKEGLTYPGLDVRITAPPDAERIKEGGVLITALDSARQLTQRLASIPARYIVQPTGML